MTKQEPTYCDHCGAKTSGRWESLSKGLVNALIKFYQAIPEGGHTLHLQDANILTKNEYNNFQKLRYFGLVARNDENVGHWILTGLGENFLTQAWAVPKKVYVVRNETWERSDIKVRIHDLTQGEPYWLKKEDYTAPSNERSLF